MSTSGINGLSSIISSALQAVGLTSNQNSKTPAASSSFQAPDDSQLSPIAKLASELQQLQQTDPAKYKQVTGQIAANLTSAAQTAQSEGNTGAANQLNQLATDFTNASQTGQPPNLADVAKAAGGHHGHHHHGGGAPPPPADDSTTSSSDSSGLSQLLSAVQTNSTSSDALNPLNIINNTLANS